MCEKISSYIFSFLTPSSNFQLKTEELDQIEEVIEKYCPSSLEKIDLEIFFQLGCLYSIANIDGKFLKWLSKVEDVSYLNSEEYIDKTLMKTKIVLGNWYRGLGDYALSEIKLKEAEDLFWKSGDESTQEFAYLKLWFNQSFGMLYLARYLESANKKEKQGFYAKIEKYFNKAINGDFNETIPLMTGSDKCNIQADHESFKKEEKILMREISIQNDELDRDFSDVIKLRNQEVEKLLDKILPKENNLTNFYKEEISKALKQIEASVLIFRNWLI